MSPLEALSLAISKAGSQAALAKAVGKSQGHVSVWLRRSGAPEEICPAIEAATGVPCEQLRPERIWIREHGHVTHYQVPVGPAVPTAQAGVDHAA